MQIELLDRKRWMTYVELATAMADYIVNFYRPAAPTQLAQLPGASDLRGE
jgi:hypothetical protein